MMMPQEGKKKFAQRLACAEVYFSSCATTTDPKGTVERAAEEDARYFDAGLHEQR
jgi:hypothetical protein